jgi:hypothetical protein
MVDLAEIQAAYYMVAATGVLVAAIYYIINLRYNMKAREMEICRIFTSDYTSDQGMQRYAIAMNLEWKDYEDFMEKYGNSNPEMFGKWYSLFFVWETMGYLVKRKIAKTETLYALGAWGCIRVWEKYKDIIESHRSITMGLDYMSNFEFLADEMLKIKTRNDASFKDKLETYRRTLKP